MREGDVRDRLKSPQLLRRFHGPEMLLERIEELLDALA
jgi:hypothetical protein